MDAIYYQFIGELVGWLQKHNVLGLQSADMSTLGWYQTLGIVKKQIYNSEQFYKVTVKQLYLAAIKFIILAIFLWQ